MSIIELVITDGYSVARINHDDPGKLGEGSSIEEAVGSWVIKNQKQLGLKLTFFANEHPVVEAAAEVLYGPKSQGSSKVMALIEELVEERCIELDLDFDEDINELTELAKMCIEEEDWDSYEKKTLSEARPWVSEFVNKLIVSNS